MINDEQDKVCNWFMENKLSVNTSKTNMIVCNDLIQISQNWVIHVWKGLNILNF